MAIIRLYMTMSVRYVTDVRESPRRPAAAPCTITSPSAAEARGRQRSGLRPMLPPTLVQAATGVE
jgi:hypothetical protein